MFWVKMEQTADTKQSKSHALFIMVTTVKLMMMILFSVNFKHNLEKPTKII